MRCFDIVFWSELQRYVVLPSFQLFIKLTNGIEKLTVCLLGCFYRVQPLVYLTLDNRESTHETEEVHRAIAISEGYVANIVRRGFAGQLDVHIVIVLHRGSARSQTDAESS
jgi:hypothetical protein